MKTPSASQIEHELRRRRVPRLPAHLVPPYYDGLSIASIAPTIAKILDVDLENAAAPFPGSVWEDVADDVECVILLLLDAVGYLQLRRYIATESSLFTRMALAGQLLPITSVFPSTTVAALTSIWTGRTPLGHGFVGTKLLLPEQGLLANLLKMTPATHAGAASLKEWGFRPESFVTVSSLAQQLSESGVETVAHTRRHFIGSSLTQIFLRGMNQVQGYVDLSDLWINLRRVLGERPAGQRLFVDVYWGGADNTGHVYGPENEYMSAALRHLVRSMEDGFLSRLAPETRKSTLLMIAADHGQIATPSERIVRMPDHPRLQQSLLVPPAGESRAAYLYARPGQASALGAYIAEHLSESFAVLDTELALEAGLWGDPQEVTSDVRARLGDMILVAISDARLSSRDKADDPSPLRGHHGSLTAEEMLVPLLLVRLDEL